MVFREMGDWQRRYFPELNRKLVTRTSSQRTPWLMFSVLHEGDKERAKAMLEQTTIHESEKKLIYGIYYAWLEDKQKAIEALSDLGDKLTGINKCWPDIILAIMYLDLGDYDKADQHISGARRYSHKDKGKENLAQFIDLIMARSDIERGIYERAYYMFLWLAKDGNEFIKAQSHYLMGYLGRLRGLSKQERKAALEEAINRCKALCNWYYVALANIELSMCMSTRDMLPMGLESVEKLNQLGRTREAKIGESKLNHLKEQLDNNAITYEEGFERIGKLLIISRPMQDIRDKLHAVACYDVPPVLITGGPGSGKEELARAIHLLSPRKNKPFISVNCAAIPENLFESELFGYEKGAYTGALQQFKGLIEQAEDGTLFLDEIGELSMPLQAKLLRVLQPPGPYRRINGTKELYMNARVVAATNRNLAEMVRTGAFRQDLYDRLQLVWHLVIPNLNDRPGDIIPLAEEFLKRYGKGQFKLSSDAITYLVNKVYVGNVRQLGSIIERGIAQVISVGATTITREMIVEDNDDDAILGDSAHRTFYVPTGITLQEAETRLTHWLLKDSLRKYQGRKLEAAKALGIKRANFYRLLKKCGLDGYDGTED